MIILFLGICCYGFTIVPLKIKKAEANLKRYYINWLIYGVGAGIWYTVSKLNTINKW